MSSPNTAPGLRAIDLAAHLRRPRLAALAESLLRQAPDR